MDVSNTTINSTDDFWVSIADRVQPGWRQGVLAAAPQKTERETQTVRLYLFDSESMCLVGAALSRQEFLQTRQEAVTSVEEAQRLVEDIGRHIAAHGEAAIDPASTTAYLALTCVMVAISRAKVFDDESIEGPTVVEGDWYIVLYHLRNGKTTGRLSFIANDKPGLPKQDDVYLKAAQLVLESTSPSCEFSRELSAGGGPVLNPIFKGGNPSLRPRPMTGQARHAPTRSRRGKTKR